MNKQELVSKFLENGLLLKPSDLKLLSEQDNIDSIINFTKSTNNIIVKSQSNPTQTFNYKIKQQPQKQKITPKDFIEYYNKKFETLKNTLTQKLDAVSINNLQQEKESYIIGVVGAKTTKGFFLEDQTSKLEAAHIENIKEGSVLGFKGILKEKTFFVKEVVYPDIPLSKPPHNPTIPITLTTKEVNSDNLTISPNNKEKKEKLISNFDLPTTIILETNQKQINILIFKPQEPMKKNQATQTLKLRCLPESTTPNQNNIIEEVPDIFWIIQLEKWKENYKGVLIVSGEDVNL